MIFHAFKDEDGKYWAQYVVGSSHLIAKLNCLNPVLRLESNPEEATEDFIKRVYRECQERKIEARNLIDPSSRKT
ncbi:MAG: hypothetical protein WC848_00235 [Parcubacteria group bacterium]